MGFGDAYINVQLIVQKLLDTPLIYDKRENRLLENPKMGSIWCMKMWYIGNMFITMVELYSICHLAKLIKYFDYDLSPKAYREEILVYVFTVAITTQSAMTWYTVERDPKWLALVMNDVFHSFDIKYRGWPNKNRAPHVTEIVAYILTLSFVFFPVGPIILPIIRKYDPINRMFMLLIPILSDKQRLVLVIIAYFLSCLFGAVSALMLILLTLTHSFVLRKLMHQNILVSKIGIDYLTNRDGKRIKASLMNMRLFTSANRKCLLELLDIKNYNYSDSGGWWNLHWLFRKRYIFHTQACIIIRAINHNLHLYVPCMTSVGIVLCVTSNYGVIAFYGRLAKVMIVFMIFTTICVGGLMMFMLLYASRPVVDSESFIRMWKRSGIGKRDRKQLKGAPIVAFTMGSHFTIQRRTAMDTMDTILNYTVSVLMS
ncbi:unnamed protein product [Orchesella dallaii]|uniref:Odorant receptor n=1 Tax=Orchesella dallaii TaxID=48710 RepID=A0ABP1QIL1_9HEXA